MALEIEHVASDHFFATLLPYPCCEATGGQRIRLSSALGHFRWGHYYPRRPPWSSRESKRNHNRAHPQWSLDRLGNRRSLPADGVAELSACAPNRDHLLSPVLAALDLLRKAVPRHDGLPVLSDHLSWGAPPSQWLCHDRYRSRDRYALTVQGYFRDQRSHCRLKVSVIGEDRRWPRGDHRAASRLVDHVIRRGRKTHRSTHTRVTHTS